MLVRAYRESQNIHRTDTMKRRGGGAQAAPLLRLDIIVEQFPCFRR